jgi:phosphoglucosamine mutase
MPRKEKRSFPLGLSGGILPNFNLSDRLCYFLDLQTAIRTNKPLTRHKQALFNEAKETIVQPMSRILAIDRFNQSEEIKSAIAKLEEEFSGNGRVLIRPSGTEPLVRVMIEGEDQNYIEEKATEIAKIIEEKLK